MVGRFVGLTTLSPSVSRLSRQYGIFKISQPYRTPRPVTRIGLLYILLQQEEHYQSVGHFQCRIFRGQVLRGQF
jgi:hypothetical protein